MKTLITLSLLAFSVFSLSSTTKAIEIQDLQKQDLFKILDQQKNIMEEKKKEYNSWLNKYFLNVENKTGDEQIQLQKKLAKAKLQLKEYLTKWQNQKNKEVKNLQSKLKKQIR